MTRACVRGLLIASIVIIGAALGTWLYGHAPALWFLLLVAALWVTTTAVTRVATATRPGRRTHPRQGHPL